MPKKVKYQLPARSLTHACATGDLELVKNLVREQGPNKPDAEGASALHTAASYGKEEVVGYLIREHHADVDIRSLHGHTPLMCATRNGKCAIVKMLLEAGADPTLFNNELQTAEDYAIAMTHHPIVCHLRSGVAGSRCSAEEAVSKGNLHRLKTLAHLDNWKPTAAAFHTALTLRVSGGITKKEIPLYSDRHTAVVKWMLSLDSTLVNQVAEGRTHPIIVAVEGDDVELLRVLIENGVDVVSPIQRDEDSKPAVPALLAQQLGRPNLAALIGLKSAEATYANLMKKKQAGIDAEARPEWITHLKGAKKDREQYHAECVEHCLEVGG